jgi:hypothetical protein
MKSFKTTPLLVGAIIAAMTTMQPLPAQADDAANYARYQRYSRAVGDWWFYHPGFFSAYTFGAPRYHSPHLHHLARARVATVPHCQCAW